MPEVKIPTDVNKDIKNDKDSPRVSKDSLQVSIDVREFKFRCHQSHHSIFNIRKSTQLEVKSQKRVKDTLRECQE